jgi:hypothetical protein
MGFADHLSDSGDRGRVGIRMVKQDAVANEPENFLTFSA